MRKYLTVPAQGNGQGGRGPADGCQGAVRGPPGHRTRPAVRRFLRKSEMGLILGSLVRAEEAECVLEGGTAAGTESSAGIELLC